MKISFDKSIYSREALIKASYQFTGEYYVYLSQDDQNYIVELTSKKRKSDGNDIGNRFKNEMLAQTARQTVLQQTGRLREIILARALASTVLQGEDIDDMHEINTESTYYDNNLDDILEDWFEKHE